MTRLAPWFDVEGQEYEVEYTVSAGSPAVKDGHPDDQSPAEGPEIEVLALRRVDTGVEVPRNTWAEFGFDPCDLRRT